MRSLDALGTTVGTYVCTAGGICEGTSTTTQRLFLDLQSALNQVSATVGISKVSTDGKIGPRTVAALQQTALALSQRLGNGLDRALEDLLIDTGTGSAASDVAGNAEAILAALRRGGLAAGATNPPPATQQPWSVITTVRDLVSQIVATGAPQPTTPQSGSGVLPNPYVDTPPATPLPADQANSWTYPPYVAPPSGSQSAISPAPVPRSWGLIGAVLGIAIVGASAIAIATRDRSRLGCVCRS